MIEIKALTKRFGSIAAVDDVTLSVGKGEVLGLLGPNGAGKSTTMKMLVGFLTPTSGTASVCGFDVIEQPLEVKKRVGYLAEGAPSYGDMTARRFLEFVAEIRGYHGAERDRRVGESVDKAQLHEVLHQPIDTLSKGFKRRVAIAQALLHDPEVLILDEPTDGLDPNQKHEMRGLIQGMAAEKTTIISTHLLEEVTAVCTRAVIIAGGRIVADSTPLELAARSPSYNAVTVGLRGPLAEGAEAELAGLKDVARVEAAEHGGGVRVTVYPRDGANIAAQVSRLVHDRNWEIEELLVERGQLDEVFRDITGAAPRT